MRIYEIWSICRYNITQIHIVEELQYILSYTNPSNNYNIVMN